MDDGSVLGSEVCIWSELYTEEAISSRIWPRAAAMTDKLWSEVVETNLTEVQKRLNGFYKTIKERGISGAPITNQWCELNLEYCFDKYEVGELNN